MGRKIVNVILSVICVLLLITCVGMLIMSVMFGSESVVGVFGSNLYISDTDEFELVKKGSAVIVENCTADELEIGNLVLYKATDDEGAARLGYTEAVETADGVYTVTVSDSAGKHIVSEGSLVGVAAWSSDFLGAFIRFIKSPLGICLIAILPCVALMIFELIRGAVAELPPPEVVPQVKNVPEEEQPSKLSVKSDGSGAYLPRGEVKPSNVADSVLFRYKTSTERIRPQQPRRTNDVPIHLTEATAKPAEAPAAKKPEEPSAVPMSVAARRYVDSTLNPSQTSQPNRSTQPAKPSQSAKPNQPVQPAKPSQPSKPNQPVQTPKASQPVSTKTAEMKPVPQRKTSEAFFSQSSAPQIGGRKPAERGSRNVIELEDALASAKKGGAHPTTESRDWRRTVSSSALIAEDDDSADKSRYEVDSILAGLDRKRRQ